MIAIRVFTNDLQCDMLAYSTFCLITHIALYFPSIKLLDYISMFPMKIAHVLFVASHFMDNIEVSKLYALNDEWLRTGLKVHLPRFYRGNNFFLQFMHCRYLQCIVIDKAGSDLIHSICIQSHSV